MNTSSRYFIFFVLLYGIQGIFSIFHKKAPVIDLFTAAAIILIIFIIHRSVNFNKYVPLFLGLGFLLHTLGLYQIIQYEGYIGTLYGGPILNYHYDLIVHVVGVLFFSLAFCHMIYTPLIKGLKSKMLVFVILFFFMLGIGALNEAIEYVGFDVLGHGEGFLEFGDGDSTASGGPWENASLDLMANMVGSLIGVGAFLLTRKKELG